MAISYKQGVITIVLAGLFWSFVPIGVREFSYANVWQILFYRSLGVLPLVYLLIARSSKGSPIAAIRATGHTSVFGAIGLVIAYACAISALRMTTIANAAFLFATAPFFAAVLSKIILGENIRRFTVIALTIAMLGTSFMVFESYTAGNWLGDLLALLSSIGFAIFVVSLRANKTDDSLPVVFLGAVFSVIAAAAMCLTTGTGFSIPTHEIILGICLGAFILGVGMILCSIGSKVVPAAELSLLCMTEIVFAPIWAWLLLNETPNTSVLIGGAAIVTAIVLNALSGMRYKRAIISV
ncbi:MAG: DMT family transporter [Granulosicoccaceae bacterium]